MRRALRRTREVRLSRKRRRSPGITHSSDKARKAWKVLWRRYLPRKSHLDRFEFVDSFTDYCVQQRQENAPEVKEDGKAFLSVAAHIDHLTVSLERLGRRHDGWLLRGLHFALRAEDRSLRDIARSLDILRSLCRARGERIAEARIGKSRPARTARSTLLRRLAVLFDKASSSSVWTPEANLAREFLDFLQAVNEQLPDGLKLAVDRDSLAKEARKVLASEPE